MSDTRSRGISVAIVLAWALRTVTASESEQSLDFIAHTALRTDDLDEALSVLAADDITPDRISEIDGICRQAFLTDPAGNQVELNQPL